MWIITDDDMEYLRGSSGGAVDAHQPLAAPTGLYFQPYCASVPMPSGIIARCIDSKSHPRVFKCSCHAHRFKLLGTMMAKALLDGRAFPIRISYALARCICGEVLDFDDLSSILNPHFFAVRLHAPPQARCRAN